MVESDPYKLCANNSICIQFQFAFESDNISTIVEVIDYNSFEKIKKIFLQKKYLSNFNPKMNSVLIDVSCFIHEIPLNIFEIVCHQLDQNERWQRFARIIGYENSVIEQIIKKTSTTVTSPAAHLLSQWSEQNHTVTELFMVLYRMKEYQTMEHLRDLVDSNYHQLIVPKKSASSLSLSALRAQVNAAAAAAATAVSTISTAASQPSSMSHKSHKHHHHHHNHHQIKKSNSMHKSSQSLNIKGDANPFEAVCIGIPKINCGELKQATNDWHKDNVMGRGAFGTVYRGRFKCTEVAIKHINCHGYDKNSTTKKRLKQILVEMRYLNAHRHDNILPLYGYTFDGSSACLVYKMMALGSLNQRLRQKNAPLTYAQRLNIAIGTAKGLHFLHTSQKRPTVHGDIKSANILLDNDLNPRIGDFGLACHSNGRTKSKRLYGTHGYLADDFMENLLITTKNDVFAFGVILFELATGLRPYDERRGIYCKLSQYVWAFSETPQRLGDLIESRIKSTAESTAQSTLLQLIRIGFSCTRPQSIDRPEMSDVLDSLLDV